MNFEIDRKINVPGIITMLLFLGSLITGFVWVQADVKTMKTQQEIHDQFRQEARQNYITRDQLNYMVIDRLDRMESNIDKRLENIEKAVQEGNR